MSTIMDGGEFNDFVVVHSTEMVDEQSDKIEILKEIPPNTKKKKKSQGKKLQNESEGAFQGMYRNNKRCYKSLSSSTRLTLLPQFKRCGNRVWLEGLEKRKKLMLADKESPCNRRWEDMDHEILIQIMKRYSLYHWGLTNFVVCKSWLSAFLDFLFPPGQVLDLRVLDDDRTIMNEYFLRRFYHYFKLHLNRRSPDSYTTIILSKYILPGGVYKNIAQRLPLLKSLVFPEKMIHMYRFSNSDQTQDNDHYCDIAFQMCPLMQNLESLCCHISLLYPFALCCKSIRSLTLMGGNRQRVVTCSMARTIAERFPQLEHLSISLFVIQLKGLKSILNGHPELQCLDLQHSVCVDVETIGMKPLFFDLPWHEEISKIITNVKTLLTCPGKSCPRCRDHHRLLL